LILEVAGGMVSCARHALDLQRSLVSAFLANAVGLFSSRITNPRSYPLAPAFHLYPVALVPTGLFEYERAANAIKRAQLQC
jgi:hypothetical protein